MFLSQVKMDRENDGFPLTALRELNILRRLRHPNTIRLLDMAVGKKMDSMFYVFEFVPHDLAQLVDSRKNPFAEAEVKSILLQLLGAVAYLHDNWIIHRPLLAVRRSSDSCRISSSMGGRDLKMSNMLITHHGTLKLCDFGLAREYGHPLGHYTPKVVTLW